MSSASNKSSDNVIISEDMQILYGFFNKNINMLKDIYMQHRLEEGVGLLSLFLIKDTLDVKAGYMRRDILPEELKKDLDNRIANNTSNIIYFYMNTPDEANMVETDIRDLGKK